MKYTIHLTKTWLFYFKCLCNSQTCRITFQGPLRNLLHRPHSAFTHVVTTRAYNYALGTVNILHNKGLADLYFLYIGDDTMSALQTAVMTTILLGSLRVTRNILGVPFYVDVDCNVEDYFQTDPYFSSTVYNVCDNPNINV